MTKTENIQKIISEMNDVVLMMHRRAAVLDQVIQNIESEFYLKNSEEYFKTFVKAQYLYRCDTRKAFSSDDVETKEEYLWGKLLSFIEKEA